MNVVVLTRLLVEVPVTVTVTPDRTGALGASVRVNVEVAPAIIGVTGLGVIVDGVMPVGRPDKDRVTGSVVPAESVAVTVIVSLGVPGHMDTLDGLTARL